MRSGRALRTAQVQVEVVRTIDRDAQTRTVAAVEAGYSRAMTTIIDSNMTTLISTLVLFWLGSGAVRGFAVTLTIGILASMFTAVTVTRLMVSTWLRWARPAAIPI